MATPQLTAEHESSGTDRVVTARRRRWSRRNIWIAALFLAPALILLGFLVVYPLVFTVWRSFFDASGDTFIGGENYVTMFTDPETFVAIRNNVIWVIVAPVTCTILGLIFAVLMDKIRWKTAFRLIVFMPMAISMVAAGVIFRSTFQENPQVGAANAALVAVHDLVVGEDDMYPNARVRADAGITPADDGAILAENSVTAGNIVDFPLVGIPASSLSSAEQATAATAPPGTTIAGTIWADVVPGGGGTPGQIGDGKKGVPELTVQARDSSGAVATEVRTRADGTYQLTGLTSGEKYVIALPATNFAEPYKGVAWLGPSLITAVVILSYIWIWAGFAMIMIASGLSALDRSVLEAARMDGANEWKVFTKVTAPMLAPVLLVVFVTLIINVLKIFDLVYVIPPGSSLPSATVIAVQMWQVSFGGGNDQGLGSALAVLLLVLVLPSMILNVRRFKTEKTQ